MAREGLGGSHGDLGAGMHVDAAFGLARDGRADDVADAQDVAALALDLPQGVEGVGRLAGLGDGEPKAIALHDRVPISKLARELGLRGNAGDGLEETAAHEAGVKARAGRDDLHAADLPEATTIEIEAAELGAGDLEIEAASQGPIDGLGLLEDLLFHETGELPLLDGPEFPGNGLYLFYR